MNEILINSNTKNELMIQTFYLDDSNPKAQAFINFIKTLEFISTDDKEINNIPQWQQDITLKRLEELDNDPSKAVDFDEILEKIERKYDL